MFYNTAVNVYILQNATSTSKILQFVNLPSQDDIVLYNSSDLTLRKLLKKSSANLIEIPSIHKLESFKSPSINLDSLLPHDYQLSAEYKRGYLNKNHIYLLNEWIKNQFKNTNIRNLICFNKMCIVPFLITYNSKHLNNLKVDNILEIEVDNTKYNHNQLISYSSKDDFIKKNQQSLKIRIDYKTSYLSIFFYSFLSSRCAISPNLTYLLDRLFGTLANHVATNIIKLFFKLRIDLSRNIKRGIICQISDDTALTMPSNKYFDLITQALNKNKYDQNILFIHPKERSIQSMYRYLKLSIKYKVILFFGGLDLFSSYSINQKNNKIKLLCINSSSRNKYKHLYHIASIL